jgi:N6-adenosine-specific RNA methylase IME4
MLVKAPIPREMLVDNYVAQILDAWQSTVEGILDCGKVLVHAKDQLDHGRWLKMLGHDHMPFGVGMVRIFMRIARNKNITNEQHVAHLPPRIGTLNELAKLKDAEFEKALASGKIHPLMERSDARSLYLKTLKHERLRRAAEQNVGTETSLWLVDPPWRTSFKLPYPTMSLSAIMNLRMRPDGQASTDPKYPSVPEASARCAAIGLWAIDELLPEAEGVLAKWEFKMLRPRIIWDKGSHVRPGTAALMRHEYLLIGVRGGAEPFWKDDSVIRKPHAGLKNSEKPAYFHELLAKMFPLLIQRRELFARRVMPGWNGWGNQYPQASSVSKIRAPSSARG